jgi:NADH-quinone oxidoreductase subunit N
MTGSSYPELLRLTLPAILVALTALLVLVIDLSVLRASSLVIRLRSAMLFGCAGCAAAEFALARSAGGSLPEGMFVATPLTRLIQMALLALTVGVLLLMASARFTTHAGEYCALILFATTAMMLLVSTHNLLMVFITIEFLSLSLYVLTAFDKGSLPSAEAGLKYFLFGGMSAGILLFGMSLLYGLSGSLTLETISLAVAKTPGDPLVTLALVMVMTGFAFKVAAAPFHMWAPEVYGGAPTSSAALISSGSKVAAFFALFTVFTAGLMGAAGSAAWGGYASGWAPLLALIAAVSMVWGNLAALAQTSMRRLLAYSAVGHAGYMLIAVVAHTTQSLSALVFYVITYALATLGAFGVLAALEREQVDSIADLAGLGKRAPGLAFCLLIFSLSLAGVPPLAGFFGKFYLFVAALDIADKFGLLWLVLLALGMSVVSFYYYLRILKQVYVVETANIAAIAVPLTTRLMLWATAGLVVSLGCMPDLLLQRVGDALSILR